MPTLYDSSAQKKKSVPPSTSSVQAKHMKPLAAFALRPAGVRFETQEESEEVVLFLRQHGVVNVPWILLTVVLLAAPAGIFPFMKNFLSLPFSVPIPYVLVGTAFWYLAAFGFALASFIRWFFNIYIVTNKRVVDIDFAYLLYKQFSEADLDKIQDISYTAGGILATVFDFGNVLIETAGEMPNIKFESIPYPEKTVETIRSLMEGLPKGGGL